MSLQGNEPILKPENSTLHVTGTIPQEELISIDSNNLASSTFDGLALIASNNSAITNDGGGLLSLSGNFSTTSTEPLVQIDSSNVTTKIDPLFNVFVETLGSTNINMVGPLASVGSTLSSEKDLFKISGGGAFLTSNTMSPFIYFDNATVNVGPGTAQLFEAANGQLSLMGPLLDATDSTLNLSDSFLKVYGGSQITSMNPDPLVSLSNTSVMPLGGTLNHLLYLDGFGTTISVADSMFTTQNSDLTFNNDLIRILNGGQINTMSNNALVHLDGGTHTLGSSLMNLSGVNLDGMGLGSDQPVYGMNGMGFMTPSGAQAFNPVGQLF